MILLNLIIEKARLSLDILIQETFLMKFTLFLCVIKKSKGEKIYHSLKLQFFEFLRTVKMRISSKLI